MHPIEMQIKAILRRIETGQCKNKYAALNKIKTLQNRLKMAKDKQRWENFLSQ